MVLNRPALSTENRNTDERDKRVQYLYKLNMHDVNIIGDAIIHVFFYPKAHIKVLCH